MNRELFSKCSLTVSEKVPNRKDERLLQAITTSLGFKITDFASLTIEKDNVTERDIDGLTNLLKSEFEPRDGDDFVHINEDDVNHQALESDEAEKSNQTANKESQETYQSETHESFEHLPVDVNVTDRPQSPDKMETTLKDNAAPKPVDAQGKMNQLIAGMGGLSISMSQDRGSPSINSSQKMKGVSHEDPSDNFDATSSEQKVENSSVSCQRLSASKTITSQPPQQSATPPERMRTSKLQQQPHPPVDDKRARRRLKKGDDHERAENLSSIDTPSVKGTKHTNHEGTTGEVSSQEKEKPEGKIHKRTGHKDSNRRYDTEGGEKIKDGQRNDTTAHDKDTARDSKTQKKSQLQERDGKISDKEEEENSKTSSAGSDSHDGNNCGNEDVDNEVRKKESTFKDAAKHESVDNTIQAQAQLSITNQPDGMKLNGENDLESWQTPEEGDKHKEEMSHTALVEQYGQSEVKEEVYPHKSQEEVLEQMREAGEEEARKYQSDGMDMMDHTGIQPSEQPGQNIQTNMNRSGYDENSYLKLGESKRKTKGIHPNESHRQPNEDDFHVDGKYKNNESLLAPSEKKYMESEELRMTGHLHPASICRQQSEDSTGEESPDALGRQDGGEHKKSEEQRGMTRHMDQSGNTKRNSEYSDESDMDEGGESQGSQDRPTKRNEDVDKQSSDNSEEDGRETRIMNPAGESRDGADEDDNHETNELPYEQSRCDNQTQMKRYCGLKEQRKGTGDEYSVVSFSGRDTDEDGYNREKSCHAQRKLDSQTGANDYRGPEKQRKNTGDMQTDRKSKTQATHETAEDNKNDRGKSSHVQKYTVDPRETRDTDGDDDEASDDQFNTRDLNAKGASNLNREQSIFEREAQGRKKSDSESDEEPRVETEQNDDTERGSGKKAEKDKRHADERDQEYESATIEYIMRKTHYKLAKKYFEGRLEKQYFSKAHDTDEGYLFIFSSKDDQDIRFLKVLRKLKFEIVSHVEDDKPKVKLIADQLKCKDLYVKVIEHGSKSHLVGPKEKVAEVKQKIILKLQEKEEAANSSDTPENSMRQRSQLSMREDTDSSPRPSDGGARPKDFDKFRGYKEKEPYESKDGSEHRSRSLHQVDYMKGYSKLADPGVYTGRYSGIRVHIHKADITKLDVDCIVNAANTKLKHGGGVAKVIATVAGRELHDACERFINSEKSVEVTGVFVSPGGHLPAKHVLHAVGPKWEYYPDKKKCTDDLRRTVLRCLVEAMRLRLSSIALPSISAAIFKVPKDLCARSYMEAVKSFDTIYGRDKECTLKEIYFVDIDDTMVNFIKESFMNDWGEPCDSFVKIMDERFSQDYLSSKMSSPPKSGPPSSRQRSENQGYQTKGPGGSSTPQTKPPTTGPKTIENEREYQIRGIQLFITSKPALSIHTDPIITIGEEFDKLSGIEDYKVKANRRPCKDYPTQKQAVEFAYLCKPKGQHLRVLCSLHPDPKSPDEIKSAVEKLDVALRMLSLKGGEKKDVTSFVLTSSILYAEPNNKKKEYKSISQKLAGSLAKNVFEFLDTVSQDKSCSLRRVFIAANKDALPHLYKVFDSRDVAKRVDSTTQRSYQNPGPRHQSPSMSGSGHQGSSTASSQSGLTTYGRQHSSEDSEKESTSLGGKSVHGERDHGSSRGSPVDQWLKCGICYFAKETVKPTSCCRKPLCKDCNDKLTFCPYCRTHWKIRTGNQPGGYMRVSFTRDSAHGYESRGSWVIEYDFPPDYQTYEHPSPGQWYKGTKRTAYIPAIEGSIDLLKLLRLAFIRRLTFTIGKSQTTGKENSVTWNDIHHKTSLQSGAYGFPDAYYFQRVLQELRDKGVTFESMTDTEFGSVTRFQQSLATSRCFSDYVRIGAEPSSSYSTPI